MPVAFLARRMGQLPLHHMPRREAKVSSAHVHALSVRSPKDQFGSKRRREQERLSTFFHHQGILLKLKNCQDSGKGPSLRQGVCPAVATVGMCWWLSTNNRSLQDQRWSVAVLKSRCCTSCRELSAEHDDWIGSSILTVFKAVIPVDAAASQACWTTFAMHGQLITCI